MQIWPWASISTPLHYLLISIYNFTLKKILNLWDNDKANNVTCVPSEDSDQPGHLHNLIRAGINIMFERIIDTCYG